MGFENIHILLFTISNNLQYLTNLIFVGGGSAETGGKYHMERKLVI